MPEWERVSPDWAAGYEWDGTRLTRSLVQPERPQILEAVKTLRRENVVEDRPFMGRWCLSIPLEDWESLRRHPRWADLHATDNETRQRCWRRFLVHPDSGIYRVREKAS